MVARILAAVARAEVERKAARQKLANKDRADRGEAFAGGPRPFGYRFVRDGEGHIAKGRFEVVEEEALLIKAAAHDVLGGASLREIARQWSEDGWESPLRAGRIRERSSEADVPGWSPIGVKGILISPRYAGLVTYKGEVVGQGNWSAILDEATHRQLKKKLTDPGRLSGVGHSTGRTPQTLLSGIAVCGVCQRTVGTDTNGSGRRMYACKPSKHVCPPRAEVDRVVEEEIIAQLMDPAKVTEMLSLGGDEAEDALNEIARLDAEMEECAAAKVRGELSLTQYIALTKAIEQQRRTAEKVLEHTDRGAVVEGLSLGTPKVAEQWELMNLHRQRAIIERFLTVELLPVGRKQAGQPFRTWDPDLHVRIELKRGDE
jgi:site-specific DNA recombinase